jgi:hypothetical protein
LLELVAVLFANNVELYSILSVISIARDQKIGGAETDTVSSLTVNGNSLLKLNRFILFAKSDDLEITLFPSRNKK